MQANQPQQLPRQVQLAHGETYLSPTGRRCTLCPNSSGLLNAAVATLLYCHADGTPAHSTTQDGFTLARFNWYLLRKLA